MRNACCVSQITKYKVDTLKSKHSCILCIVNDDKTVNSYMFWPLKRPSSGCTFSKKELYNIQCTMYLLSDEISFIVSYNIETNLNPDD